MVLEEDEMTRTDLLAATGAVLGGVDRKKVARTVAAAAEALAAQNTDPKVKAAARFVAFALGAIGAENQAPAGLSKGAI